MFDIRHYYYNILSKKVSICNAKLRMIINEPELPVMAVPVHVVLSVISSKKTLPQEQYMVSEVPDLVQTSSKITKQQWI